MFHKWISEDDNYVSCLKCGYLGEDIGPDDWTTNGIIGYDGEEPTECTSPSSVHGYAGETYCHACDDLECEHTRETDGCNCFRCN